MVRPNGPALDRPPLVLESLAEILSLAPVLETLAARCEQAGAMHWLPYFLDPAVCRLRKPRLVLFARVNDFRPGTAYVEDVDAAALFFEYTVAGVRTGVFVTGDAVGFSSVIAPADRRARVAAAAAKALAERGAVSVLATFEIGDEADVRRLRLPSGMQWATRSRQVGRMLSLLGSLEETLAQMGKSTRFNLRYYRRRLERQVECEFFGDAGLLLEGVDLDAVNTSSLNPVSSAEFKRRVRCARTLPGSFLCGLRDSEGKWLSLVGGWRQGTTTVLHWQMNAAGLEKHSLGTVMRSYLLEHEISRGAKQLLIYGGTPHTMRHAFQQDTVSDLVLLRPGLRALAIRAAARWAGIAPGRLSGNFVLRTLADPELAWSTQNQERTGVATRLLEPARPTRAA